MPLALSFDFLAEKSPDTVYTPNDNDLLVRGTREAQFKEESNDEKQVPMTEEANPTKEDEEEKQKKIKEQLRSELKEELRAQILAEVKTSIEQDVKKQYEERIRNEEAEFKNETLQLEDHIKELKQELTKSQTQNERLIESKVKLLTSTSEQINNLRDMIRQVGKSHHQAFTKT